MAANALASDATRLRALVYGDVESPLLQSLRRSMTLIPYNGKSEQMEKAQLVILDGDHLSPETLQSDEVVATALRSGLWVLALNVTENHKIGLRDLLTVATDGADLAYLVHMGRDENNRPQVDVVEVPIPEWLGQQQDLDPETASNAAQALLDGMMQQHSPGLTGSETPPPGLLYVNYHFTHSYFEPLLWPYIFTSWNQPANKPQSPRFQANESVTVYLNNRDNPQGDYQFVVAESEFSAAPKVSNESFANFQPGYPYVIPNYAYAELGWFQTRANASLTAPSAWTTNDTSPETVNGQTSVTSGVNFTIGFNQAQGGTGSFGYSSSTTHNITDWKVTNDTVATQASWQFRTNNPIDADQSDYYCREQTGLYNQDSCYPTVLPNDLSTNTLQLHTSAVWQTPSVVDETATITVQSLHEMVLLWCPQDKMFPFGTCLSPAQNVQQFPHTQNLSINLGAVLPVPIASITFDQNPARAGNPVTGTVSLTKPALMDTEIQLKSNSENATVLPSVMVKNGETSANFQVLTNANGLGNCGSTTATIDAFYAQDFQTQLQVTTCK